MTSRKRESDVELTGFCALTRVQVNAVLKAIGITLDIDDIRRADRREDDCCMTKDESIALRQAYAKIAQALRLSGGQV